MRARVLVGTLVSFGGGIISRLLQHKLPTHPRPFYDPALGFHPSALATEPLNSWNSFPSDHAAVFGGLVAVICLAHPRLGIAAVICGIITEFARTYVGAHYPSDLIGGAALGFTIVWAAQASWAIALARRVVEWECSSPSLFYMCGFFITYQIATLFSDIRDITGGFSLLVHLG
jgi:membrane-associated phospholipid phosphatase